MAEYYKRDIARILKKPPRTIEYWTSSGLVIPDIEPSQGKGKARVFSGRNLLEFGMIEVMARMEISLRTIKDIMDVLRKGKWFPENEFIRDIEFQNEEEYKQWQEDHTVNIVGFWVHENWGVNIELVYVETKGLLFTGDFVSDSEWYVLRREGVNDTFDIAKILKQTSLRPINTVLFLGCIKHEAMRLIFAKK